MGSSKKSTVRASLRDKKPIEGDTHRIVAACDARWMQIPAWFEIVSAFRKCPSETAEERI